MKYPAAYVNLLSAQVCLVVWAYAAGVIR